MIQVLTPVFSRRNFGTMSYAPRIDVNTYSHAAIGGPDKTTLTIYGVAIDVWKALELLRCPVTLKDEMGQPAWWGFASRVTVKVGSIECGISIDEMANRVAILTNYPGDTEILMTAWAENTESSGIYGDKELITQLPDAVYGAEYLRNVLLAQLAAPTPLIDLAENSSSLSASIECKGWWDTLNWIYYQDTGGIVSYWPESNDTNYNFGTVAQPKIAQSFKTGEAWTGIEALRVMLASVGDPTDNVVVDICANNAGVPGTVLFSATLDGATLEEYLQPVWFQIGDQDTISAATTYWLVLDRSGADSNTNYYSVGVDITYARGYADGALYMYNGSTWAIVVLDTSYNGDLLFEIIGTRQTSVQLEAMATAADQFLTGVTIINSSGVYTPFYRTGDTTALAEIIPLLQMGGTNGRRLLARITPARVLEIYAEPAYDAANPTYYVDGSGQIYSKQGLALQSHLCPVAGWAQYKDIYPSNLNTGFLADASHFFIERAEYNPHNGRLHLEPRVMKSAWDIGK